MKAYLCAGDMSAVYLRVSPEEARRLGDTCYPELTATGADARVRVADSCSGISLFFLPPYKGLPRFSDALGLSGIRGITTLISERARALLEPHLHADCTFLPVSIPGAPYAYHALYVTRLLDCLDTEQTRFGRPAGDLPAPISTHRLIEARVSGLMFRLPGGLGYQYDYDFATERFVTLVQTLALSGFRFRENLGARSFGT